MNKINLLRQCISFASLLVVFLVIGCGRESTDSVLLSVSIDEPSSSETVSDIVNVKASVVNSVNVVGVQFKLDNINIAAKDSIVPYSISWNTTFVSNGVHVLTAVVRDIAGNSASSSIPVTVSNVSDQIAPRIPSGLLASAVSSSRITLSWGVATDNISVAGYKVFRKGVQIATTAINSYTDSVLMPSTTYSYTIAAYDAVGNTSSQTPVASATTFQSGMSYSTNFDLTENPISEDRAWSNIGMDWTYVVTSDGIAYGTHHATGYNDSYALLSGFAADQSVEGTIFITGSFTHNQEVELLLRWSQSANVARGYEILWQANNSYAEIVRWNGALGDFTILQRLSFPRAPITGDVMKAQIVGSVISVYLNNEFIGSYSDSTWKAGNPGIGFYSEDPTGGQNARYGFTSYTATDY